MRDPRDYSHSLSFSISWSLLQLMSFESVRPSNHLILCHPLFPPSSLFPGFRVFTNESALHIKWPKYWSFSISINPSNEYSGLISFRIDLFDLLAVQGTLKNLFQHHGSKEPILQCSDIFKVQLSHPYLTIGKTIVLTRWSFVGKVLYLFLIQSRFVIVFHPRNKCLNLGAVVSICSDFGAQENKVCHCFHCFPICHEVMGLDIMIFFF